MAYRDEILRKLEGGDRRSIGKVDEVVAEVLADPSLDELTETGSPAMKSRGQKLLKRLRTSNSEA